jgi:hypothetical protein
MDTNYLKAHSEGERNLFIRKCRDYIGVDFPLSFIDNNEVYLGYHSAEAVCGFVIVKDDKELRSLACIPSICMNVDKSFIQNSAEVTGLWVDESIRSLKHTVEMSRVVAKALESTGRQNGLIIYDPTNRKLSNFYKLLQGKLLYQGMTTQIPGMKKPEFERVEYFSIKEMRANFVRKFEKAANFLGVIEHGL